MAVIGTELDVDRLVLVKGRDFNWVFEHLDADDQPSDFPDGQLFFEFNVLDESEEKVRWEFDIDGSEATLKVESTDVDAMPNRTKWQLVFLPAGEEAGGTAQARGTVVVQL